MASIVDNLPDFLEEWEKIYDHAINVLSVTKVKGRLDKQEAQLGAQVAYYKEVAKEIYNVSSRLDSAIKHKRGMLYRFYMESYPKALTSRDIDQYINSDDDYYVLIGHKHDVDFWLGRYDSLIDGLDIKNWQLSNLTKLHIAGYDDVEVNYD